MRKKKDDGFNTSAPDLIAEVRAIKVHFLNHPAFPLPWPHFVPPPEHLDEALARLEKAIAGLVEHDMESISRLNRARRELKTMLGKLVRYVEMVLGNSSDLREWPGFDLSRHPGERRRARTPRATTKTMVDD